MAQERLKTAFGDGPVLVLHIYIYISSVLFSGCFKGFTKTTFKTQIPMHVKQKSSWLEYDKRKEGRLFLFFLSTVSAPTEQIYFNLHFSKHKVILDFQVHCSCKWDSSCCTVLSGASPCFTATDKTDTTRAGEKMFVFYWALSATLVPEKEKIDNI